MATAMDTVELELCPNCKKEIPQINYVMHTMHCARNISLCPICKEPIPKGDLEAHKAKHAVEKKKVSAPETNVASTQLGRASGSGSSTTTWKNQPYTGPFPEKLGRVNGNGNATGSGIGSSKGNNGVVKPHNDLSACKYCELELPKDTMKEHEDYCGTRTDKCNECGEFVMFKYKKLHEESNHGFIKLKDEPGPKPSWDSSTERSNTSTTTTSTSRANNYSSFDMSSLSGSGLFNMADYIPPSLGRPGGGGTSTSGASRYSTYTDDEDTYRPSGGIRDQKKIDYKDLSRRLDCKTEYIRNLLHDSASITAPFRTTPSTRNHYNHNKGPAPQPPSSSRRPNPPTELTIPCEFCNTPIPHEDLIQHETGCRPDLARFNPRRRRQEEEFYRYTPSPPPTPDSPEVQLPCEFCSDMIPASQLLRHQATCN